MSLLTTQVRGRDDVRRFFDRLAADYRDCHGRADRLLAYRLGLIRELLAGGGRGDLLEIGCGTGFHLFALAAEFDRATGTDLSPAMIAAAEGIRRQHPAGERVRLAVDAAEELATIADASMDVVLCVGAFEHLTDRPAALRQIRRVLRQGGRFVCLTPNAGWFWYAWLAPALGLATTHLSSDRFVAATELASLLEAAGLRLDRLGYWTFVPAGDMPRPWAAVGSLLDGLGRWLRLPRLRGGLLCRAVRE